LASTARRRRHRTERTGDRHRDLRIADDTVTAIGVVGDATDPTAQERHAKFATGIAAVVAGAAADLFTRPRVAHARLYADGRLVRTDDFPVSCSAKETMT